MKRTFTFAVIILALLSHSAYSSVTIPTDADILYLHVREILEARMGLIIVARENVDFRSTDEYVLELSVSISPDFDDQGMEQEELVGAVLRAKGESFKQQLRKLPANEKTSLQTEYVPGVTYINDPVLSKLQYVSMEVREATCPALRKIAKTTQSFRPVVSPILSVSEEGNPTGPWFFLQASTWNSLLKVTLDGTHPDANWIRLALEEVSLCVDRELSKPPLN